jgi:hypothetical protein
MVGRTWEQERYNPKKLVLLLSKYAFAFIADSVYKR